MLLRHVLKRGCNCYQTLAVAQINTTLARARTSIRLPTPFHPSLYSPCCHKSLSVLAHQTMELAEPHAAAAVLGGREDQYSGILVDHESLPTDPVDFAQQLQASLQAWEQAGRKGIWLRIPLSQSNLVPEAAAAKFYFHHAERDYVMMTRWLPPTENKLPANASHQVGIGAFVVNENREVLVVQERNGPLKGKGIWKVPTGLVEAAEDVPAAAEREVLEETGVRAHFDAILGIRQAHGFAFGKSDMYFVVALRPEPGQTQLTPQEEELEAVRWMPLDEYAAIPFTAQRPLFAKIIERCVAYANGTYRGFKGERMEAGAFQPRQDLLLYGEDPAEVPAGDARL